MAAPLPGSRLLLAAGTLAPSPSSSARDPDDARCRIRSLTADVALLEEHDAETILHRANIALAARGLGRLHSIVLATQSADGASVAAAGAPRPVVVTEDGLSAPAAGPVRVSPGWTVVAGADEPAQAPLASLFTPALTPADVESALALFDAAEGPGNPVARRTLVALRAER